MFRVFSRQRVAGGLIAGLLLAGGNPLLAGESRIELSDGSLITGELVGIDNGQYRIRSTTLGEMSVPESAIRSIQPPGSGGGIAPDVSAYGPEIASIQQQLATNPGLMGQITALQNDPAIQAVLADPELTRLILAGDLERLRADPRIQRLMEHPGIQGIVGQMAR
ncbi:hypothetical protein EDC35_10310 [Thiobaca trueperi]|uniref:STI1 domain-containing protein n=2 Tax=Thiobaca trueperi TaxID=127458 RepID=A0A4V2V1P0_9GAMM|nr:hypothetical protein EDC35_10310 [Thiobaca trueperi]